jgi:phosphatidylglycerophosphate synthase
MPSIAEIRAVVQPEGHLERPGDEHWAGRLYMRRVSVYVTRALVATPLSANGVTLLMIPVGLLAALALTYPGVWGAVAAVLLVQLKLLLDCCDGEVARWRGTTSIKGVYLDVLGHYSTEAAFFVALGIRADGGWDSIGAWTAVGLGISVLVLYLKAETLLVTVVRAQAGKPPPAKVVSDSDTSRLGKVRLREGARLLPSIRPFNAVEASLLALAAAVADSALDSLEATRVLLVALLAAAFVAVVGHALSILASQQLK